MSTDGTKRAQLDQLNKNLEEENKAWDAAGMHVNMVQHDNVSIFELKCKVQAMWNCLSQGKTDQIDFDLEIKRLILHDMRSIRQQVQPQMEEVKRQALLNEITKGIHVKMPWEGKIGPNGESSG
jgi:ATP-dependent Lon protease